MAPKSSPPTRTVVVSGDLLTDVNLLRHARTPEGHHVPVPEAVLDRRSGGAWYLEGLVRLACSDLNRASEQVGIHAPEQKQVDTEAYSIWSLHERERDKPEKAWRVREFLGCARTSQAPRHLPVANDRSDPNVLVLDDLTLGFRDEPAAWPAALQTGGSPRAIVLKSCSPLASDPLWQKLIDDFADRLTVVLDVGSLRERRAPISRAVSWDLAIEETVREIEHGPSARDLGRCWQVIVHFGSAGAAVFTRCPPPFERPGGRRSTQRPSARARFLRFLYHPRDLEGSWEARHPGVTFGTSSILVAAVTRHLLDPETYPLFIALGRALAAVRVRHERGAGDQRGGFAPPAVFPAIQDVFHPPAGEPASTYCSAFPHHLLDDPSMTNQPAYRSELLRDVTGPGLDYTASKAIEVVLHGPEQALRTAPSARYGKYFTVDRQEIERINAIRNLLRSYAANPEDHRPLSVAVFGPPGSGKSFAIKQLAAELFGPKTPFHEFNLSQLSFPGGLHLAFHIVRDSALGGWIPIVFWDEFDTDGLSWLKSFLAPMQDGTFQAEGATHPLGKAVFVFAGGTAPTFEAFDRTNAAGPLEDDFRKVKGPDFVSRLRGYVNIKGPNPQPVYADPQQPYREPATAEQCEGMRRQDPAHLIRRAIILRIALERFKDLIDPETKTASISLSVIRAFLRVQKFVHGARSLDAVVNMSDLVGARHFAPAQLPSPDLLRLHVTPDFLDQVRQGELEVEVIEALAKQFHERWRHDLVRDVERREDPLLRPYDELSEAQRELSRAPARLTGARLQTLGYVVRRLGAQEDGDGAARLSEQELEHLMRDEHDRWMREKLLDGFQWAQTTNKQLRLHQDIAPFEAVPAEHQVYDRSQVEATLETLATLGYTLKRGTP